MVGTGYVGLVSGTCFAEMGSNVTCVDVDGAKIDMLSRGEVPIYEPELDTLVEKNLREGRLHFTTNLKDCIDKVAMAFIAVGTPTLEDGTTDMKYVLEVASEIGRCMNRSLIVVTKSTVPVGASRRVKAAIEAELEKRGVKIDFEVASNPEFLKEGSAVKDFMLPDRIVVGVESEWAKTRFERLYKPFTMNGYPLIFMDIASSEMTKYAANAMLATRISFMNEIANLCEKLGADVDMVREGIGSDPRIGARFLYSGSGYGGSCFPKDVRALATMGRENGCSMELVEAVEAVNRRQKRVVYEKLSTALGANLKGKVIALWGLAYKPDTDDMREAPSLDIMKLLLEAGAVVRVFDPAAMNECRRRMGDAVVYAGDMYDAASGADALALVTEWKQFRMPDWEKLGSIMRSRVVVDGRNIYDRGVLQEAGFVCYKIGRR